MYSRASPDGVEDTAMLSPEDRRGYYQLPPVGGLVDYAPPAHDYYRPQPAQTYYSPPEHHQHLARAPASSSAPQQTFHQWNANTESFTPVAAPVSLAPPPPRYDAHSRSPRHSGSSRLPGPAALLSHVPLVPKYARRIGEFDDDDGEEGGWENQSEQQSAHARSTTRDHRSVSRSRSPPSGQLATTSAAFSLQPDAGSDHEAGDAGRSEGKKPRKRRRKMWEEPRDQARRKYKCPTCGKAFARPSAVTIHERNHTHVRPFVCPRAECIRGFTTVGNLRRHQKVYNHYEEDTLSLQQQQDDYADDNASTTESKDALSEGSGGASERRLIADVGPSFDTNTMETDLSGGESS